jgi:mannosyltransferase
MVDQSMRSFLNGSDSELTRRERWAVAGLTLLALVVRLIHLDYRGMWTDEFHTLNAVLLPWGNLITERLRAGHLPTYFLFMKLWTGAFGTSDIALRLPSALAGSLIVPATIYFARPWLARPFVWALAVAMCFNGTAVWASQEARMYAMLLVAATWAHGALARAVIRQETRAWKVYTTAALVAVALQPVMILWIVAHGIFAFVVKKDAKLPKWRILAIMVGAVGLLIVVAIMQEKRSVGFDSHSLKDFVKDIVRTTGIILKRLGLVAFGLSADTGRWRVLTSLLLFTCLGVCWREWRRRALAEPSFTRSLEAEFVRFCALLVALPVGLLFIASLFLEHVAGNERYLIPLAVPLWALIIWGLAARMPTRLRDGLIVCIVLFVAVGLVRHWRDKGLGGREIVYFINRHALPNDAIVCRATPTLTRMIEHYGHRGLSVCAIPEPSRKYELDMDKAYEALTACLGQHNRFWLVEYRGKGSFLRQLILRHSDEFEPLKETTIQEARCVLVRRKKMP